jgi:platelet-activating factor acetylhydrolase
MTVIRLVKVHCRVVGSKHISFSDFTVLPGLGKRHGPLILDVIGRLSLAFLEDSLKEALEGEIPTTKMTIELVGTRNDGTSKERLIGDVGHVVVS